MCEKSEERTYYIRTSLMYTDLTREVLFKVLKFLIKSEDITDFLSSLEQQNLLRELLKKHVINQSDYNLVSGQVLNLERFDISLLVKLILNLCKDNIPEPQRGWETKPNPKDESLGADLLRLSDVRNKIIGHGAYAKLLHLGWKPTPSSKDESLGADLLRLRDVRNKIIGHRADAKLSETEYEKTWAKIKAILLRVVKHVDSQSSKNFEQRINEYRRLNVDTENAEVKRRMDELLNFKSEFEHLQAKVEELSRRSNEFQEYFKTIPKRFVSYIKLLFNGGRIVLYGIMKTKLGDQDLLDFLERKKELLTRNIDEKFSRCLYSEESCSDYKTWDVFLLASVLLLTFDNDLSQREIMYIERIKSARVNYAALALQSLDADDFLTIWTDLIICLKHLSINIAKDDKLQVENLIVRYKKTDEGGCDDEEYLEQLRESGDEVKTLNDVYNETITELKHMLNQLSRKDIKFKQEQVLEFKLLTICENEEFKKRADDLLQASIQQLDQPPDSIRKEMDKLVAIIAAHPDVEVKQECIVLSFKCSTPGDLLHILDVTQGDQFKSTLQNIANELHYIYRYAFLIQGKCTLESVLRVSTMINKSTTNETSSDEISIPLKCSSVNGIRSVLSAVNLETTTNSLNTMTELMSAKYNEHVSIELIPDMMEFRNMFEETDEMETEVVQEHEVGEKNMVSAAQQSNEEIMNEYAVENKEPEGNIKTIRGTFQATQNHTKDVIVGEKRTENELGKEEGIPKKIRILDDYGRQDEVRRYQGVSSLQTEEEKYQKSMKDIVMTHKIHLQNNKYRQWVKAGLGLYYLKEGLAPFCDDIGKQQHKDIIKHIQRTKTIPNVTCGVCQITTLQPDHVRVSKGICPLRQDKCNCFFPNNKRPCPNNVCGAIYDSIIQYHASIPPAPFWRNSDAHDWSVDPWSISKCFINAPGYKDKTSAADTDCAGLLHVIINNRYFHNHIGCNVTGPNNLFSKVRSFRNEIFHSSSMELEEYKTYCYIDDMIAVLQDGTELLYNQAAQQAVVKLHDLKSKDFNITTESFDEILRQIRDEMKKALELTENAATKEEYDELKNKLIDIETQMSNEKEERQRQNEEYEKAKSELKDGLIEFYKTRHSKVFLGPLFEENDTPLASFYIRPELNLINSAKTRNDEKRPIKSLSEMFKTGNQANREIHVIADAGLGKTAFSKYLAITWCQAHFPDEDMTQSIEKGDIDCMKGFDFLFLVLLRDSNNLCSIDDLVFKKIVSNLGLLEKPSEDFLLKILKTEKCLVILDGLDEWTHPEKECHRSPRSIPHRNDRDKCAILTTTRPWKLGVLNLNSCQIGNKVELTELSYFSAVTLAKRILQRLKSHANKDALHCDVVAFISGIKSRQNDELTSVPLLLIYMICLWCDGVQIGNSKCELYINIVELLLSRTIQKHGDLQQLCVLSDSDIPECLAEYENCTKNYPLLMSLGKLAYYTLFNETRENTLVFDGSVAKKYLITDEMKFTLHSGMLSESTTKTLTRKYSKVSFSHKTVQEFFAAIFISSEKETAKIVLEKCRNVQDILDMAKICEFISKMNPDLMCAISNHLTSVINEDEETRDYRTRTGDVMMYNNPLYNIQAMFMSCLQEMPESENIQLCLQDFFIDRRTMHSEQLQRLLKQNKTNIKSLYIYTSSSSSSLREIIDLCSLTDLSHILKLCYSGKEEEAEISRILFPSLQNLTLLFGEWTNDEENLSENMARCQNLQYLCIANFTLSHKILESFFNFISGQKSMKELTLMKLRCKEHGYRDCKILNMDLYQHSTLSMLVLGELPGRLQLNISTPSLVNVTLIDINLDESSLVLSRDMLHIELLELEEIEMSAGSLQNLICVLVNLPQSVTVKMSAIKPKTEYERVRKDIRRSQTFHVIDDGDCFGTFVFKTRKSGMMDTKWI